MRRMFLHYVRLALLLLTAPSVGGVDMAEAQRNLNAQLRGDYAITVIRPCVQSSVQDSVGFDGNLRLVDPANTRTNAIEGILHYRGDGTGSVTDGRSLQINHSRTSSGEVPVILAEFTCDLTYTVNADRTFTQELTCPFEILEGGTLPGTTGTVRDIAHRGRIALEGQLLLIRDTEPNVETVELDDPFRVFKRICARTAIAVRISGRR